MPERHGAELLARFGFDQTEIDALRRTDVLGG
jgi:hypothetical protein